MQAGLEQLQGYARFVAGQQAGGIEQVIGVDMNDDMMALARKYQPEMARKFGGERVRFVKGYIHDLALDLAAMDQHLAAQPVTSAMSLAKLKMWQARQRASQPSFFPLIGSVNVS